MSNYLSFLQEMLLQCNTPLAPLRSAPSETAELESQVLYGESVTLLELSQKDWIRIRNEDDGYEGWTDRKHFIEFTETKSSLSVDLINPVRTGEGLKFIPFGSKIGKLDSLMDGSNGFTTEPYNVEKVIHFARRFENAPYLWGGKTILGIDCSGYMQLIHKPFGIDLPRNASQQALTGTEVIFEERKAGDIAFFVNDNGKVVHVGILADPDHIWHASGCVRLDGFNSEGILNKDTELISHKLFCIKRIV